MTRPGPGSGSPRHGTADDGSALLITMMVVALVTILATTVLSVTVNNLGGARRSQQSAAALDAAEAGVAQALAQLRSRGTHALRCSPACTANAWGNSQAPAGYDLPGTADQSFSAWIEPLAPFPENDPAVYRVHSVGRAGNGVRAIEVDVSLGSLASLPLGLFGRTVEGGGNYTLTRASVFSTGCVYNRDHIGFTTESDAAYGIPTGVHSSQTITLSNGNNQYCTNSARAIHRSSSCSPGYPNDQDAAGGSLMGTGCESVQVQYPHYYGPQDLVGDAAPDVDGSFIRDEATLRALFGIAERPFTPGQLDDLKALARSQGSYYTSTTGFSTPDPALHPNSVMFFDLSGTAPGGIVDLKQLDETKWGRVAQTPGLGADDVACPPRSLLIVIDGGNVRLNGGESLAASVVLTSAAPNGKVLKHNGSAGLIGTLYADSVDLSGTAALSLDECFMSNLSPSLLHADMFRYLERDRE
jgi:type II secretory pathway pseudopilin PulG